jgi:hypothetical protein
MININKSRKNIINLDNDDWEFELEKKEVYLTKFSKSYESSDDEKKNEKSID